MLHGTNLEGHGLARRIARTVATLALTAIVLPVGATAASATSAPVAQTPSAQTPSAQTPSAQTTLVRDAAGRLHVQRAADANTFAAATTGTVIAAEQDVAFTTTELDAANLDISTGLVSDAYRADQWALDVAGAESVWTRGTGEGEVIAIIDSGVDGTHPDLTDRLIDGFTTIDGGNELVDQHGHGTHVAGTAAASVGDNYGIAGLAPEASIMPVQVTDANGVAYSSDVAEGVIWAVDNGATIINLSLAGPHRSTVLAAAIDYAADNGTVVVAAAGNEGARENPTMYPAAEDNVLAIGATGDRGTPSAFSSNGSFVDLAAPGSAILSNRPGASFGYASGTSMAAPFVAGAIAALKSAADVTGQEAVDALIQTATDVGDDGRDDFYGDGLVDVLAATDLLAGPAPEIEIEITPSALRGWGGAYDF